MRARDFVLQIQQALANLTGAPTVRADACRNYTVEPVPQQGEQDEEDIPEDEVRTGQQTLRTSDFVFPSQDSGTEEQAGSQTLRAVSIVCLVAVCLCL